jgi:hypothetical protein
MEHQAALLLGRLEVERLSRVHSLFIRLSSFGSSQEGFRCADLRHRLAALFGRDPESLSQGAITYQLRRLRLHGLCWLGQTAFLPMQQANVARRSRSPDREKCWGTAIAVVI